MEMADERIGELYQVSIEITQSKDEKKKKDWGKDEPLGWYQQV